MAVNELDDVQVLAERLIATHLSHSTDQWVFRWDHARRRAGACHHDKHEISLSRHITSLGSIADAEQTLLHEIAHALCGKKHNHSQKWLDTARSLGYTGWGAQSWATWEHDANIGRTVLASADVPVISSSLTNEGGGIHTNGDGTILVTETVQLDPGRNPGWSRDEVERELFDTLGATRFVWLPRGLTRDYDEFGTRGHVDIVAAFCNSTTVLYHDQRNPEHPDFEVSEQVRTLLEAEGFDLIAVPAPDTLRDDEGFVDYSYINHYVCNGAVILCGFDDPGDEIAKGILEKAYPGRTVELVDARALFARGGGIHCITQQQPA